MTGFLQGFFEEEILFEAYETRVILKATEKAIEIAIMGLAPEAQEILGLVNLPRSNAAQEPLAKLFTPRLQFFMAESRQHRESNSLDELDEEKLLDLEGVAKDELPHLPEEIEVKNGSEEMYSRLKEFAKEVEKSWCCDATTGYDAMQLSAALAGLLFMAKGLGHEDDIPDLMKRVANRIHANQQSRYLASIRFVWREYLLSGWLREKLGVSLESTTEYARFILATTEKRLDEGPQTADELYADYSMEQLLAELDRNTISSPSYQTGEYAAYPSESHDTITSILLPPATASEISETETRIGRPLPTDLKDFLRVSNGCLRVKTLPLPAFQLRLPPLSDIFWEDDDFMLDYRFILLPDVDLGIEVEWPGIEFGGIAFYEHEGQGTEYVWLLTEELVEKTKGVLQKVYDEEANEEQRKKIDDAILRIYGSREAYDAMKSCMYLQAWGEPTGQKIWTSFRSYLNWVVLESRDMRELSPLKVPENIL
ncbi:hypothetical protein FKW77_004988 [Venturia effusa]|uniref:Knr4/Smi1-like domain-containing protein n=1 Tax=Venturia effusa TaxID=50376 RepID=A0A517LDN0_9PEZI|nr:hypothetical protein FKW77_004988 [Venturia effusa]